MNTDERTDLVRLYLLGQTRAAWQTSGERKPLRIQVSFGSFPVHGIYAESSTATIVDTHFTDNQDYAAYFYDIQGDLTLRNLTASDNGYDGIALINSDLAQTATVELRIRRLDMPADWAVTVTPVTVTLAADEQVTATATIRPGFRTVQGAQPRVAIEGYISDTLIGGVVLDVMVSEAAFFDGKLRVYLPLVLRDS